MRKILLGLLPFVIYPAVALAGFEQKGVFSFNNASRLSSDSNLSYIKFKGNTKKFSIAKAFRGNDGSIIVSFNIKSKSLKKRDRELEEFSTPNFFIGDEHSVYPLKGLSYYGFAGRISYGFQVRTDLNEEDPRQAGTLEVDEDKLEVKCPLDTYSTAQFSPLSEAEIKDLELKFHRKEMVVYLFPESKKIYHAFSSATGENGNLYLYEDKYFKGSDARLIIANKKNEVMKKLKIKSTVKCGFDLELERGYRIFQEHGCNGTSDKKYIIQKNKVLLEYLKPLEISDNRLQQFISLNKGYYLPKLIKSPCNMEIK
jgi:hypothetical protein